MGLFFLSGAATAGLPAVTDLSTETLKPFLVHLTGYNAVPEQTDSDPTITASGAFSNPEIIAARSRDLAKELPFGTIIEIDGPIAAQKTCGFSIVKPIVGYRVIADTMHPKFTKRIDLLFDTEANYLLGDGKVKNAGIVLGICDQVAIRVVGRLDMTKVSKLPKTQAELASLVESGKALALK